MDMPTREFERDYCQWMTDFYTVALVSIEPLWTGEDETDRLPDEYRIAWTDPDGNVQRVNAPNLPEAMEYAQHDYIDAIRDAQP